MRIHLLICISLYVVTIVKTVPIGKSGGSLFGELGVKFKGKKKLSTPSPNTTKKKGDEMHHVLDIIANLKRDIQPGDQQKKIAKLNIARDFPIQTVKDSYKKTDSEIKLYKKCSKEWLEHKLRFKANKLRQHGKLGTTSDKDILEWTRQKVKEKCGFDLN